MIQFNLLPEVKLEYVKSQRTNRLVMVVSGIAAAVMLLILTALFVSVEIVQKKYSRDLSEDIRAESSQLTDIDDLNKILTIQNQLASLTTLHDQKPVATRMIEFIKQVTPANASISTLNVDFATQTISIAGSADSIGTVNKFVDTLKFTSYKTKDNKEGAAFSAVVLTSFGRGETSTSYQLSFNYDPTIFSSNREITLVVPEGKITTRSQTEKPDSLFDSSNNIDGAEE